MGSLEWVVATCELPEQLTTILGVHRLRRESFCAVHSHKPDRDETDKSGVAGHRDDDDEQPVLPQAVGCACTKITRPATRAYTRPS